MINYNEGFKRIFNLASIPISLFNAINISIIIVNDLKHSTRSCETQLLILILIFLFTLFSTYFLMTMARKTLVWLIDGFIKKA